MKKKKNTPLSKHLYSSEISFVCPVVLFDRIKSLGCSRINEEHVFRLVALLLKELYEGGYDVSDYYGSWSKSYLNIVVTDNFKKTVWPLICFNEKHGQRKVTKEDSIFQTDGNWSKKKKKKEDNPLHYRINPHLLQGNMVNAIYRLRLTKEHEDLNFLFPELMKHFASSYAALNIKLELFKKNLGEELDVNLVNAGSDFSIIVRNTMEGIKYSEVKSIPKFFVKEARVIGQDAVTNVSSSFLVKILHDVRNKYRDEVEDVEDVFKIILDGKKVCIDNVNLYLPRRNERAYKSALYKARAIDAKLTNHHINLQNGRFTTPLTEFNKIGIKYLSIDGVSITSFDLKSSQVVILANLMLRTERLMDSLKRSRYPELKKYLTCFLKVDNSKYNLESFMHYLLTEDIYVDLANDIGVIRPMSKVEMFKILFTEPGAGLPKYSIREKYPDFFSFLKELKDEFKKEFGESSSSISYFLQMVEAHIFLECILTTLAKEGILAFSKHDSVLVSSHKHIVDRTFEIIEEQKALLGFQGNFVKEEYDVIDWLENPGDFNDPNYNLLVSHPYAYKDNLNDFLDFDLDEMDEDIF